MLSENLPLLKGTPTFRLYDENMNLKHEFTKPNMIVGTAWILSRLSSNSAALMSHIAVGTNGTATTAATTILGAEISRVGVIVPGGEVTGATLKFNATFGPGVGTGILTEAGVFNAASSGTLFSRVTFSAFTKSALDTLDVEWVFTQV